MIADYSHPVNYSKTWPWFVKEVRNMKGHKKCAIMHTH
jgi:hypothetical protein